MQGGVHRAHESPGAREDERLAGSFAQKTGFQRGGADGRCDAGRARHRPRRRHRHHPGEVGRSQSILADQRLRPIRCAHHHR